jgi:hypothetical protein
MGHSDKKLRKNAALPSAFDRQAGQRQKHGDEFILAADADFPKNAFEVVADGFLGNTDSSSDVIQRPSAANVHQGQRGRSRPGSPKMRLP